MEIIHFQETIEYQAKNNTREWTVKVVSKDDQVSIVTIANQKGSAKPIVSETVVSEGKNVGKKNETTPLQQALTEAKSKLKKTMRLKLDTLQDLAQLGASVEELKASLEELKVPVEELKAFRKPMLLHKHDPAKVKYPCLVQPKFNGVRCLARVQNAEVVLYSRQFKIFPRMDKIKTQIKALALDQDVTLDGELYLHGKPLQEIVGAVRRQKGSDDLENQITYVVYDVVLEGVSCAERLVFLDGLKPNFGSQIALAERWECASPLEVKRFFDVTVANGYEGIVVRNLNGLYLEGYRSQDAVKYKATEDDEYECVGYGAAQRGKEKDKLMLTFKTAGGKLFNVRPHMPFEQRGELLQKIKQDPAVFAQLFEGKRFTIVYHSLTKDGIPSHIIDCVLRDYE